jgi:hypothetical protein
LTITVKGAKALAAAPKEGATDDLDGNQSPSPQSGEAPNGSNYVWQVPCASLVTIKYSGTLTAKLVTDVPPGDTMPGLQELALTVRWKEKATTTPCGCEQLWQVEEVTGAASCVATESYFCNLAKGETREGACNSIVRARPTFAGSLFDRAEISGSKNGYSVSLGDENTWEGHASPLLQAWETTDEPKEFENLLNACNVEEIARWPEGTYRRGNKVSEEMMYAALDPTNIQLSGRSEVPVNDSVSFNEGFEMGEISVSSTIAAEPTP